MHKDAFFPNRMYGGIFTEEESLDWLLELPAWVQAMLATLFTYFMTALGASFVFFSGRFNSRILNAMQGTAAGIMIAASFFSLLLPAKERLEAANAGAKFIISPDANSNVIRRSRELGLVSIPGVLSPTEITSAWEAGADFVKLFPVTTLGLPYIKAVRAPLNHIPMMAVGGVNEENLKAYLDAGLCGAGIGGNLVNKAWIEAGEFDKITALAKKMVGIAKGE